MGQATVRKHKLLARVSTESVHKCTGRHWDEWVKLLDQAGARAWEHKEIVAYLKTKHRLTPWWQQGVTGGYEVAIGRKVEGQNLKGEWSLTATKTFRVAATELWKQLSSDAGMALWLQPLAPVRLKAKNFFETRDGYFGEIRTLKSGVRIRLSWRDPEWAKPTYVQIFLLPRPGDKCLLAINHEKLPVARLQGELRRRWKKALDELARAVEAKA
jgi:uncharacterized protein YndB with AHSA1/START domain